jgi:hypothetical protein
MNVREMFDLNGKVATVAGGGRGIGLKMAEGLAEAGANIVLCSGKVENRQKSVRDLAKLKVKTLSMACDVKSPADIHSIGNTDICMVSCFYHKFLIWFFSCLFLATSIKSLTPSSMLNRGLYLNSSWALV